MEGNAKIKLPESLCNKQVRNKIPQVPTPLLPHRHTQKTASLFLEEDKLEGLQSEGYLIHLSRGKKEIMRIEIEAK